MTERETGTKSDEEDKKCIGEMEVGQTHFGLDGDNTWQKEWELREQNEDAALEILKRQYPHVFGLIK